MQPHAPDRSTEDLLISLPMFMFLYGDRNAESVLQSIEMMLPPRFQPEFSPGMLTCNLREIEGLCGVKFSEKESWWKRMFG